MRGFAPSPRAMSATSHHAHQSELLTEHLRTFLPGIEPEALELLCSHLEWVEVPGGGTLISQGEPGESMYIAVSGRLRAYVRDADGQQRRVADMGRRAPPRWWPCATRCWCG
jgi:NTE family protein